MVDIGELFLGDRAKDHMRGRTARSKFRDFLIDVIECLSIAILKNAQRLPILPWIISHVNWCGQRGDLGSGIGTGGADFCGGYGSHCR